MGFLDRLFGSQQLPKERLIRELARIRIQSDPASPLMGFTPDMVDALSGEQLLTLPEASIVAIVDTYVVLTRQGAPPEDAINRIDEYRVGLSGLLGGPSSNIFDFVAERVRVEHANGSPLDEDFLDRAVVASGKLFGLELHPPSRSPYLVAKECRISTFVAVLATYRRREAGYFFPWRLIILDERTEQFVFSYNLERTSLSCCLASQSANGVRMNLGPGDPDMPVEEFESWAVPKAIARIYGDQVLSEAEAHLFGVKIVAEHLENEGLQVLSVAKDPQQGPQLWFVKDGSTAAVVVRVGVFPEKGDLEDESASLSDFIKTCREQGHAIYLASVGLANANARNDYERGALLRNGSYHVVFAGLERVA